MREPDFCYCCRRIDRQEMDCPLAVSMQKANMKSHMEFGPWMRAKGPSFHAIRIEDNSSKSIRIGTNSKTQSGESSLQPYDGRIKDDRDDYVEVSNEVEGFDLTVKGDRDTCKKN